MGNKEKFEGFKKKMIDDNEKKYGKEIREKYGDDTVDESNRKLAGMSEEQWNEAQRLSKEIGRLLKEAMEQGDPACAAAQEACELHKEWLCMFWKEGMYSKAAHIGLGEMYVADERFKAHYDAIAPGCAELLRDAIAIYCSEK